MAGGFKSFFAFWLGRAGAVLSTPVVITDIRSGRLTLKGGTLALHTTNGSEALEMSAGLLSLREIVGSSSLEMSGGTLQLVITS